MVWVEYERGILQSPNPQAVGHNIPLQDHPASLKQPISNHSFFLLSWEAGTGCSYASDIEQMCVSQFQVEYFAVSLVRNGQMEDVVEPYVWLWKTSETGVRTKVRIHGHAQLQWQDARRDRICSLAQQIRIL